MSRGLQSFKQTELTKAIKAVEKAGVKAWRVEISNGKIMVVGGTTKAAGNDEDDRDPSDWD
jgi:hypothetical protein